MSADAPPAAGPAPAALPPLPPQPLVSIIVPSFNQGRFIAATIDSCLAQDYRPLEVLVVDGASTDGTVDVLSRYAGAPEVRWTSEPDSGVVEAVNKGLQRARGAVAAIQSSDDAYEPGAVAAAVAALRRDPAPGIVYGDCITVDAENRELRRYRTGPFSIENFLSKSTIILQPAAFFRLELARAAGGWDPRYFNADTELWLRMIVRAPALKIDRYLARRRRHPGQRNRQAERIVESYTRMMAESAAIRGGPRRWRRAARCGVLLHRAAYTPVAEHRQRQRLMWRAVWAYPRALLRPELAGALIPFYHAVRRRLGRGEVQEGGAAYGTSAR